MVTGCRFTSDDPRGMKMLEQVTIIFTQGAKVAISDEISLLDVAGEAKVNLDSELVNYVSK